jgi:small multidrug resistance pump
MNPYITLALAIVSELAGTTALKFSDGFTNPLPSVAVVAGVVILNLFSEAYTPAH